VFSIDVISDDLQGILTCKRFSCT